MKTTIEDYLSNLNSDFFNGINRFHDRYPRVVAKESQHIQ
jgi:hypothetical protein